MDRIDLRETINISTPRENEESVDKTLRYADQGELLDLLPLLLSMRKGRREEKHHWVEQWKEMVVPQENGKYDKNPKWMKAQCHDFYKI